MSATLGGMSFLVNATPVSPQEALWDMLQALMVSTLGGVGRFIRTSGSGTGGVYSQAGNVITSESVLLTANAWFVLRCRPYQDGQNTEFRELCVQVNGAGNIRLKYSARAGFTGGLPSAVRTPSAVDEYYWLGGGTDAAPTFDVFFPSPGHRMQGYASEVDDTFWFLTYPVGGGPASSLIYLDLPQDLVLDTGGNFLDKDPAVLYQRTGNDAALMAVLCGEATAPRSVFAYGDAQMPSRQLWGRCSALRLSVLDNTGNPQVVYPGGGSTSLLFASPTYPEAEIRYVRRAGLAGIVLAGESGNANTTDDKGVSSLIRWAGAPAYAVPTLLDQLDPNSGQVMPNTDLAIGNLLFTWGGAAIQL